MADTPEQLVDETINRLCQSLSGNPLFPDDSIQELLDFVTFLAEFYPFSEIIDQLKEQPDDQELRKEAKLWLSNILKKHPENMIRLSDILAGDHKVSAKPFFNKSEEIRFPDAGLGDKSEVRRFAEASNKARSEERRLTYACHMERSEERRFAEEFARNSARKSFEEFKKSEEARFSGRNGDSSSDKPYLVTSMSDKPLKEKTKPSDQAPQPKVQTAQEKGGRVVNTGFSSWDNPDQRLFKKVPLAVGQEYLFCMNIGDLWEDTLETVPTDIPKLPEHDAVISVVVFGFPDGIRVTPDADRGELKISGGSNARVIRQPIPDGSRKPVSSYLDSCLFFPVVMPSKPEEKARMRCNIYWENVLLQSRLVTAKVVQDPTEYPKGRQRVIRSDLDYCISGTLAPFHINRLEPHCMSLLFNSNEDTQSIFIEGSDRPHHAYFGGGEIQDFGEKVRKQLRLISWGDANEWNGSPYRYEDQSADLDRLKKDLISLAKWGYEFYFKIFDRLEGDKPSKAAFEEQMGPPGYIQIAMRRSPNYIIPAAMIYDYPLYVSESSIEYGLCPEFEKAFHDKTPLEDTPCFQGNCPTKKRMKELHDSHKGYLCTTICPSGFWGFRHFLGMPISLDRTEISRDISLSIPVKDKMIIAACVSTEVKFLKEHEVVLEKLKSFVPDIQWHYADEKEELFPTLMEEKPHAVYFYCHGDLVNGEMQLRIGSSEKTCMVNTSNLKVLDLIWKEPRPLVFLNGCHTAGLSPLQVLNFIEPFVTFSNGAGVIGTETTIFEELARSFSEHFFKDFFEGKPVGHAIRNARLALLGQGNPLGLVYTPYILPSLKLVKSEN